MDLLGAVRSDARRVFVLFGMALAGAVASVYPVQAAGTAPTEPEAPAITAADDPLQMVISLDAQTIDVYKGLEHIKSGPISSGRRTHPTPTGIFSILEKRRRHYSNLYRNAPMPFMQRLTWSGVALHAGRLPGYPASHGCIRLKKDFAKSLYGMTGRGLHVVVTRGEARPQAIAHPALFQPEPLPGLLVREPTEPEETEVAGLSTGGAILVSAPLSETVADLEYTLQRLERIRSRSDAPLRMLITLRKDRDLTRDVQVLLSELGYRPGPIDGVRGRKTTRALTSFQDDEGLDLTGQIDDDTVAALYAAAGRPEPANAHLYVRQKFKPLFDLPVALIEDDEPVGTHLFTALDFKSGGQSVRWMAVSAHAPGEVTAASALDRLIIPESARQRVADLLTPGSSLIVTDRGFRRHTTLGTDFIVETRH